MLGCDCWYCGKGLANGPMQMSREFDTPVHYDCIVKALKESPQCPEARIFGREFSILLEPAIERPDPTDEEVKAAEKKYREEMETLDSTDETLFPF